MTNQSTVNLKHVLFPLIILQLVEQELLTLLEQELLTLLEQELLTLLEQELLTLLEFTQDCLCIHVV